MNAFLQSLTHSLTPSLTRACVLMAHQPRYVCELRCPAEATAPCSLVLVETNAFKNLTHLALSVVPGDDSALKTYLAECLASTRAENRRISAQCTDMAAAIDSLQQVICSRIRKRSRKRERVCVCE